MVHGLKGVAHFQCMQKIIRPVKQDVAVTGYPIGLLAVTSNGSLSQCYLKLLLYHDYSDMQWRSWYFNSQGGPDFQFTQRHHHCAVSIASCIKIHNLF